MDVVELGRHVLTKREEKRLSQSDLGAMVGISRNNVVDLQKDKQFEVLWQGGGLEMVGRKER